MVKLAAFLTIKNSFGTAEPRDTSSASPLFPFFHGVFGIGHLFVIIIN